MGLVTGLKPETSRTGLADEESATILRSASRVLRRTKGRGRNLFFLRLKSAFRTTQTGFCLNAHSGKWDDCRCDPPTPSVAAHCGHMCLAKIGISQAFEGLLLIGEVSELRDPSSKII